LQENIYTDFMKFEFAQRNGFEQSNRPLYVQEEDPYGSGNLQVNS